MMKPTWSSDMVAQILPGIGIFGPGRDVQGRLHEGRTHRNRCSPISGLVVKASARLRPLMKYALLLLINVSAFTALNHVRVWRSRSALSCHRCSRAPSIGQMAADAQPLLLLLGSAPCVILLVVRQEHP